MARRYAGRGGPTWTGNLAVGLLFATILFAFGYCLPMLVVAGAGPSGGPPVAGDGTAPGTDGSVSPAPSEGTQPPAGGSGSASPSPGGTTPASGTTGAGSAPPAGGPSCAGSTTPSSGGTSPPQTTPTTTPATSSSPPATPSTPPPAEPAVFELVLTPPLEDDFDSTQVVGDVHAWQAEVMDVVAKRAQAAGLIVVTEEPAPDGSGTTILTSTVTDQEALDELTVRVIAELAHAGPDAGILSPGGWVCAVMLDRMLSHGIADPEACVDVTPPFITPLGPLPDATVRTKRPVLSASFEDGTPSAGLDPTSLAVLLDGQPLAVLLPDGSFTFSYTVPFDLAPGYHHVVVVISDLVGQKRTAEWRFTVAP